MHCAGQRSPTIGCHPWIEPLSTVQCCRFESKWQWGKKLSFCILQQTEWKAVGQWNHNLKTLLPMNTTRSSFDGTLLPVLTHRSTSDVGCCPPSCTWHSWSSPESKMILTQYVLEHTWLLCNCFVPFHVLFLHRLSATGGLRLSEDGLFLSHSHLTQCRQPRSIAYCHINRHSLVEWLHICSYGLQIFGSRYLNPVFEETVLTIACSDLRGKKKSFGKESSGCFRDFDICIFRCFHL